MMAEGLERYVELMRAGASGRRRTSNAQRLYSDWSAADLQCPLPTGMKTFTTFIVREGQEIAVKIYHPGGSIQRPAIGYFHGGGFMFGSIESFDVVAAGLAEYSGAVVASVQYRRLPENSYTSAQDDCYVALNWLHDHAEELGVDPSRLAVAGDSVGALFATIAAAMARDRGGPRIACQLLMYGAFAMRPHSKSVDPLLTPERVDSFVAAYHYGGGPPLPLRALAKLPPAIILAAEHDPLREEALEYAEHLRAAGVRVEVSVAAGMIHGFLRARRLCPAADRQMIDLANRAREYLWPEATS